MKINVTREQLIKLDACREGLERLDKTQSMDVLDCVVVATVRDCLWYLGELHRKDILAEFATSIAASVGHLVSQQQRKANAFITHDAFAAAFAAADAAADAAVKLSYAFAKCLLVELVQEAE